VYQVGLESWAVTNVLAQGAHELSVGKAGHVQTLPNALAGFVEPGDAAWWALKVCTRPLRQVLMVTLELLMIMSRQAVL
jgi:hypothetical protein